MKRFISVAVLVAFSAGMGMAQTSMTPALQNAPARKSPLAGYAGTWVGAFDGHAWMTIRLTEQGTQMSGTVQHRTDIKFNDQGDIKSVGDEQITEPVENSVLNGDGLLLTVKNATTNQTDRYQIRLIGADVAEVKMVAMSMPPGMPKIKPWKVSRVTPNAVNPVR